MRLFLLPAGAETFRAAREATLPLHVLTSLLPVQRPPPAVPQPTPPAQAAASAGVRPPLPAQPLSTALGAAKPAHKATFRPAALRLDDQGREIDEFGNLVTQRSEAVTTLKVSFIRVSLSVQEHHTIIPSGAQLHYTILKLYMHALPGAGCWHETYFTLLDMM